MIDTQEMRRKLSEYRKTGECWIVASLMMDDPEMVESGLNDLARAIEWRGHAYYDTVLGLIENLETWRKGRAR